MATGDFNDGTFSTVFVMISRCSTGCDTFRAPQKTIRNPEPDGLSRPGTTKLAQRTADAPKLVQGSLTDPLDADAAAVVRLGCLGCGQALPWLKTAGSGLEQTCQRRIPDAFPVQRNS